MMNRIKLIGLFFFASFMIFSLEVSAVEEQADTLEEKVSVEEKKVDALEKEVATVEEQTENKTLNIQVSYTSPFGRQIRTFRKSHIVDEGPAFVLSRQQWKYIRVKLKKSGSVRMPRVPGGRELRGVTFKVQGLFNIRHPVIQIGEKATVNLNAILSKKKN